MNNAATNKATGEFEQLRTRLLALEDRIYTDEEIALLPLIHASNSHYKEWLIRKHSCKALLNYLKQKSSILNLLEVGCGSGWLAAQLARNIDIEVTGIDINTVEIERARRVFYKIPCLNFINGNFLEGSLKDKKFDIIILAASIGSFPSLKQTILTALEHLTLMGEIHIVDSPFYQQHELEAARQKTKTHYERMGIPRMSAYHYHHTFIELEGFQYKILHNPHSWKNKLTIKNNPFYWISIKNRYS